MSLWRCMLVTSPAIHYKTCFPAQRMMFRCTPNTMAVSANLSQDKEQLVCFQMFRCVLCIVGLMLLCKICNLSATFLSWPFSVPQCDQPGDIRCWLRQVLHQMDASPCCHFIQNQAEPSGPWVKLRMLSFTVFHYVCTTSQMFGVRQMVLIYLFIYLESKRCIKLITSDSEDFIMYHSFLKNIKQHKCFQIIQ